MPPNKLCIVAALCTHRKNFVDRLMVAIPAVEVTIVVPVVVVVFVLVLVVVVTTV